MEEQEEMEKKMRQNKMRACTRPEIKSVGGGGQNE